MKAIIGTYFKTLKKDKDDAEKQKRMWRDKIAFVVVESEKGYMVVSKRAVRACGIRC